MSAGYATEKGFEGQSTRNSPDFDETGRKKARKAGCKYELETDPRLCAVQKVNARA